MSLVNIRPYIRNQMESLAFKEWKDGFADDNIPSSIIDRSYFLGIGTATEDQTNALDVELTQEVELRVYFKGFRDPQGAIDSCLGECEAIIAKLCKFADYTEAGLKQVRFSSMDIEPLTDEQNDNVVRAVFVFEVKDFICCD